MGTTLDHDYSQFVDIYDPRHPGGAAIDTSNPDEEDGTPLLAVLLNDLRGWMEAVIIEGMGKFEVSGVPEHHGNSDVMGALKKIIGRAVTAAMTFKITVKTITGPETVIPFTDFELTYDPEKQYGVFVSPHGNYPEFLPFGTEVRDGSLHVYSHRLADGQSRPGTRGGQWGSGTKWGNGGKWGEYDPMTVNILIREL